MPGVCHQQSSIQSRVIFIAFIIVARWSQLSIVLHCAICTLELQRNGNDVLQFTFLPVCVIDLVVSGVSGRFTIRILISSDLSVK